MGIGMSLNTHLDMEEKKQREYEEKIARIPERAKDIFFALPDTYTQGAGDVKHAYLNIEDYIPELNKEELLSIARSVRDGDANACGQTLISALERICLKNAEYEANE